MKSCWPTFRLLWETAQPSSRCRGRWGAQLLEWEQPRALHLSGSELTFPWGWAVVGWGEWGLKKCKAVFESWIAAVRGEVSRLRVCHTTITLNCSACSALAQLPHPVVPSPLCCFWLQANWEEGKPEKLPEQQDEHVTHPGDLYSIAAFFPSFFSPFSFVLQPVMLTSNYVLTMHVLGIILVFIPMNIQSKMKELVFAGSKPP